MSINTRTQRPCGDAKTAGIKRYTNTPSIRYTYTLDIRFDRYEV